MILILVQLGRFLYLFGTDWTFSSGRMAKSRKNGTSQRFNYLTSVVDVTLDPYKRIVIPTLYIKQGLGKECFLVEQYSDPYGFISVYTPPRFKKYAERYLDPGDLDEFDFREKKRAFFARVKPQKLSTSKPRITLEDDMLKHIGYDEKEPSTLVFVGAGDTIELWLREHYKAWRDFVGNKVG